MTTTAREERRSALDDFARQTAGEATLPAAVFAPPLDMVHGAQQVAVRRDDSQVLVKLKALAAAAGSDWSYRFPVKNKKTGELSWIEGPSVKLANDLARLYGNCEVDCRAQDFGDTWLFHARFVDLETGFSLTRPFQQRKSAGRIGGADDERRLDIAFQIGASKAIRNVVVNALQTFADFAFDEAREALVDKIGSDIEKWRQRTVERTQSHVDIARVEQVIGRTANDWLAPDIARVIAMMKAVQDGMASLDETFPPLKAAEPDHTEENARSALDAFAASVALGEQEQQESFGPLQPDDGVTEKNVPHVAPPSDAAGTAEPSRTVPAAADPKDEAIEKVLRLASDLEITEEERIENLDQLWPTYQDKFDDDETGFVQDLFATASKVARGELKVAAARKYLETLK